MVDAQIPALNEAMGVHTWHQPLERFTGMDRGINFPGRKIVTALGGFGLAAQLIAENKAIHQAMTQDNLSELVSSVLEAQPNTQVLLANAERSLVQPTEHLRKHYDVLAEKW